MDRLVNEARDNEAADKALRDLVEARNEGESLIYGTEKALEEMGDAVPADDKSRIETLVADLRTAMAGEDLARINEAKDALTQASAALAAQAQQQAAAGPDMGGDPSAAPGAETDGGDDDDDDVIEGEYRSA